MSKVSVAVLLLLLSVAIGYFWITKPGRLMAITSAAVGAKVRVYRWQDSDGVTHFSQAPHAGAEEQWVDPGKINTMDKVSTDLATKTGSVNPLTAGPQGYVHYVHQLQGDEQQAIQAADTMGKIPDQEKAALDP